MRNGRPGTYLPDSNPQPKPIVPTSINKTLVDQDRYITECKTYVHRPGLEPGPQALPIDVWEAVYRLIIV